MCVTAHRAAIQVPLCKTHGVHGVIAKCGDQCGGGLIKPVEADGARRTPLSSRLRKHSAIWKVALGVELDGGDLANGARLLDEAAEEELSMEDACEAGGVRGRA